MAGLGRLTADSKSQFTVVTAVVSSQ